ncbi:sugar phosphate nucleotidyltransferase [Eubacterium sp.]|uniref:sugar phosphate nucleotidyltransferase n=1 Tax=Eubacterium sp. TaxID=142586 RepID=UPI00258532B5|nr:sugar phosphate nucleotidyltransferase [Eubacterium sp.]MCR5368527.1 nucleotidyltransferase [Eubacterium sp.]
MDKLEIQKFIGTDKLTVSEVMQKIDINTMGILFLVDKNERLIGCITDGDVRRYLLSGGKMENLAVHAANKEPRYARTIDEAKHLYHSKNFIIIPVVNNVMSIIDLYTGEKDRKTKKHRSPLNIPVVINAGGKGTRLDPFTRVLPKPLIPVGELPIIELIMQEYKTYSCEDFHIIVNYKKDLMKAYFHDNENNYNITWYDEEKPLGTGGGLSLLRGKFDSTFFFANCDALLTANYESMLKFHKQNGNVITMVCAYKNINIPYGVVDMGKNGTIENMREKPLISFLTNTGIYIVEPEVMDYIDDNEFIGFPDIITRVKESGKKVAVFPVSENDWMDMGQLSELEKMRIKLYGE